MNEMRSTVDGHVVSHAESYESGFTDGQRSRDAEFAALKAELASVSVLQRDKLEEALAAVFGRFWLAEKKRNFYPDADEVMRHMGIETAFNRNHKPHVYQDYGEFAALKTELAAVREELRVGNRLYAELTDKCRDVEQARDTANRALETSLAELRELARTLATATKRSDGSTASAWQAADEVEAWLEEHP